ncbi:NUDIX domain-containing protein [Micromonospora sp. NPDC049049]|uniref:NUDIX hydrolase n=1 Tax=Micromonospora sp. NPDC049049 TaxID=3155495 RepID=UPI0034031B6A
MDPSGGKVEQAEDPFDAVVREVAEETGCVSVVERLLGVDSRVIPAAETRLGIEHQNVGIFARSGSLVVSFGPRRTARPPSRSGHRSQMSPVCAGRRWSMSVLRWRERFRRPVTSLRLRSAA